MRTISLVLVITVLGMQRAANAVCVERHYSVEEEYAQSTMVVVAKAVSNAKIQHYELSDACWAYTYTVKIKEFFRGEAANTVEVAGDNGRGCFSMVKGKTYVLFLSDRLGALAADPCGNSGLLSHRRDAVAKLRAMTRTGDADRKPNSAVRPSHSAVTARAYCDTRRASGRAGYRGP